MVPIEFWLRNLKPFVTVSHIEEELVHEVSGLRRLSANVPLLPEYLYIAHCDELSSLNGRQLFAGMTIFVAAGDMDSSVAAIPVNVIFTSLTVEALYDRLFSVLETYNSWRRQLEEAAFSPNGLKCIADTAAKVTGGPVYILSGSRQPVCCGGVPSDSEEDCPCPSGEELPPSINIPLAIKKNDKDMLVLPIRQDEGISGYVISAAPPSPERQTALELIAHYLVRHLQVNGSCQDTSYWPGQTFSHVLNKLIRQHTMTDQESDALLAQVHLADSPYFFLILVHYAAGQPVTPLAVALEATVPYSRAAVFEEKLVLFVPSPERSFSVSALPCAAELTDVLTRHSAAAIVSNTYSRRSMLRVCYLLTAYIDELVRKLPKALVPLIYAEDYFQYAVIDMCRQSFSTLTGREDLLCLTNPAVFSLYQYDCQTGEQLLDALYYYCVYDCSIQKAARAAYMHRNTMSAKVKKIRQLAALDLESADVRQRVIFSCQIIRAADAGSDKSKNKYNTDV